MKFNKIVCLDPSRLTSEALLELQNYSSENVIIFDSYPENNAEINNRIQGADCVLVSWKTYIDESIIQNNPQLKFVGLCYSYIDAKSVNIDVEAAVKAGVVVKGVRDYGDEGVVEYIIAELINLSKGLRGHQWKRQQTELKNKTIGIIGMGVVGLMLARLARAFGMSVLYFSRTPKPELESEGIHYVTLKELLSRSAIVSTHLPRKTVLMTKTEFDLMQKGSIFINTSVGPTFELDALTEWLHKGDNYAIFDHDGAFGLTEIIKKSNVIYSPITSGMTDAAFERLSEKVIHNIQEYLK